MNIDNGHLRYISSGEAEELNKAMSAHSKEKLEVLVKDENLTEKQKKNMQVSLHDYRSKAGKQLQEARKTYYGTRNQKRNVRNRLRRK